MRKVTSSITKAVGNVDDLVRVQFNIAQITRFQAALPIQTVARKINEKKKHMSKQTLLRSLH